MSHQWDPEVIALLEEIGHDENSILPTLPHPTRSELLRPHSISSQTPFLTKAERHLLDVHRETVAKLLEDTAFSVMFGEDGWTAGLIDYVANEKRDVPPSRASLSVGLLGLPKLRGVSDVAPSTRVLADALDRPRLSLSVASKLLARSVSLADGDRNRLLLSLCLVISGQPQAGLRLGDALLEQLTRRRSRADANEYRGLALHALAKPAAAASAYEASCSLNKGYAVTLSGFLFQSAQAGDLARARRAAAALDELGVAAYPSVSLFCSSTEHQRSQRRWIPTASSDFVRRSIQTDAPTSASRVLSLFQPT